STLGKVWAPALFTFLAMTWGTVGWLVIAGIIVVATIGVHPSTRLARRFIEQHVPADVLADARASSREPEEAISAVHPSLISTDERGPGPIVGVAGRPLGPEQAREPLRRVRSRSPSRWSGP